MQYPQNDFQQPERLRALLGSFWHSVYDGRTFILDKLQGVGALYEQLLLDLQETALAVSRHTVPILHRENWTVLTLRQSQVNANPAAIWRFDEGHAFDSGLKFDTAIGIDYTVELPLGMTDCYLIMNRLTEPSVVLHKGLDFELDPTNRRLTFLSNPFDNTDLPQTPVFVDGVVTDYEITLWLFRGQFDRQQIYRQFGYVLNLERESSAEYRQLVNAVFDALTGCTAKEHLETLVSLMAAIPLVQEDETVEQISADARFRWVITDKHCYALHLDATLTVAVGDELQAGDTLTTGLEKLEFRNGELNSTVRALVLGKGFLANEFVGELVFVNREVATVVYGDQVSFEIGGLPGDVARFWELVRQQELLRGYTLAARLWPVPPTINPAKFLVANVLRNHCLAYRLAVNEFGDQAIDHNPADLLRRIVPPRSAILLLFELPPLAQSVTIQDAAVEPFDMTTVLTQSVGEGINDDYRTSRAVGFNCY